MLTQSETNKNERKEGKMNKKKNNHDESLLYSHPQCT